MCSVLLATTEAEQIAWARYFRFNKHVEILRPLQEEIGDVVDGFLDG